MLATAQLLGEVVYLKIRGGRVCYNMLMMKKSSDHREAAARFWPLQSVTIILVKYCSLVPENWILERLKELGSDHCFFAVSLLERQIMKSVLYVRTHSQATAQLVIACNMYT